MRNSQSCSEEIALALSINKALWLVDYNLHNVPSKKFPR